MAYFADAVTLELDSEKCVGCSVCLTVCPHSVFELNNGTVTVGNRDACMECGACEKNCPHRALTVQVGVGCAAAIISKAFNKEHPCGCSQQD
jgi:NAD-dependent dihydropyrimidine dehydrogenase PreA subunit